MFSRIAITTAILAVGTLFAEEKINLTNTESWGSSFAKLAKVENGTLVVSSPCKMTTPKRYNVDPNKTYTLSLNVKSATKDVVWILAGFECYDKNGRFIGSVNSAVRPGTDTVLTEDAKKNTNILKVKNGSRWSTLAHLSIAINTKADYSDLPNYNTVSGAVSKIEKTGNCWTMTLAKPLKKDIPAGTALRQMADGGYLYTAGSKRMADTFTTMKGSAKGIAKSGFNSTIFPAGTVKISPMILNNWSRAKVSTIYKDITLVIK